MTVSESEMATTIAATKRDMPMSRLGEASELPRFQWQQPTIDKNTPPSSGLTEEEELHAFHWGKDSILPYQVFEDYDRSQVPSSMDLITLQNGRLRVSIAPQFGGRLMELHDLRLGRDLVFANPVFQPANLGALNAWFSGGIEWNGLTPGHTPFSTASVFAGVIETDRGPVLRLYEFDRRVEATWQVDLFLPNDDDRLFVHGRIVNSAAQPKLAYWWTNVAVPTAAGMRVLSPASYSIEHVLPNNELARFPFPHSGPFDGTYPEHCNDAVSVFFREPHAKRRFIAALDAQGAGLAQSSTENLKGRKFFYFGKSAGGQQWMDYLSLPGQGDYVEIQSGITPTQNQRFVLDGESEIHWTEVYGGLSVDATQAHHRDYGVATRAVGEAVDARFPADDLADVDAFLTEVARRPVTRRLSSGSTWGRRQEALTGRPLAEGLDFEVGAPADCWDELVDKGSFSSTSLEQIPAEFAVSELWVQALAKSSELSGETWLHALLLGVAALDQDDLVQARTLFDRSVTLKRTWLGLRQRALVSEDILAAEKDYLEAWEMGGAPPALAVEIVWFLIKQDRLAQVDQFISSLTQPALDNERVHLGRAVIAAKQGNLDALEKMLDRQFVTIREGENILDELWTELQRGRLAVQLGRTPTNSELSLRIQQNPVPQHLDFRMRAEPVV